MVNATKEKYKPGDLVYLSRTVLEEPKELLTVLWEIPPEDDEPQDMPKYLTRMANHAKKVVFHCELVLADQS